MHLGSSARRGDVHRVKRFGFGALAVVFVGVAAFHAVALVRPDIAPPSPPWRHGLFAAINTVVAIGMVARPRGFVFAFAALTAQQLVSHGSTAWSAWAEEQRVDVVSLLVVIAMPVLLLALVIEARQLDARPTSARPLP
jgi:hypothetical protein